MAWFIFVKIYFESYIGFGGYMYSKLIVSLLFIFVFIGGKAHAGAWSQEFNVEKIYLTDQNAVIIKVLGTTNINDCSLVEGYQFIFKESENSKMFDIFQTALVENMKVKIYSEKCLISSWANVLNTVTFNQVNHVVLSK